MLHTLPLDALLEVVSFLTLEEYSLSFITVCTALNETYCYENVWSNWYKTILERDIKLFTKEKDTTNLKMVSGLYKKHIGGRNCNRFLVGEQYLTATREYTYSSKQRKFAFLVSNQFKKPENQTKREIYAYEEFICPYETIFQHLDKLLAYLSGAEQEERRKKNLLDLIGSNNTFHGNTLSMWLTIDLCTAIQRSFEKQAIDYATTALDKLVRKYNVSIMGESEMKKAKGTKHSHYILCTAISQIKSSKLIEKILELYQYEQSIGRQLYADSTNELLIKVIEHRQDLFGNLLLFQPGEARETISKNQERVHSVILGCKLSEVKRFREYGFDPSTLKPHVVEDYLRYNNNNLSHESFVWLVENGMPICDGENPFVCTAIYCSEPSCGDYDNCVSLETIEYIIRQPGVDLDAYGALNENAIITACYYDLKHSVEIVKMLVAHGADPYAIVSGRTALWVVCDITPEETLRALEPLLTNQDTLCHFNALNESPPRTIIRRYEPAVAVEFLRKWIEKFNIDLNQVDGQGNNMRQWAATANLPTLQSVVQEVFDLLGITLE